MIKVDKAEKFLKALLLKEYEDRLKTVSLLKETSMTDEKGRVVLEPDLKVRHKKSGFEYTIKKVLDDHGNMSIILRTPEAPRIKPAASTSHIIAGIPSEEEPVKASSEEGEFTVNQDEFEKNYEVD